MQHLRCLHPPVLCSELGPTGTIRLRNLKPRLTVVDGFTCCLSAPAAAASFWMVNVCTSVGAAPTLPPSLLSLWGERLLTSRGCPRRGCHIWGIVCCCCSMRSGWRVKVSRWRPPAGLVEARILFRPSFTVPISLKVKSSVERRLFPAAVSRPAGFPLVLLYQTGRLPKVLLVLSSSFFVLFLALFSFASSILSFERSVSPCSPSRSPFPHPRNSKLCARHPCPHGRLFVCAQQA